MCQQELSQCHQKLTETQKMHANEKEALAAAQEKIQKLERRLIFVTKVSNNYYAMLYLLMSYFRTEKDV